MQIIELLTVRRRRAEQVRGRAVTRLLRLAMQSDLAALEAAAELLVTRLARRDDQAPGPRSR